MEQQLQELLQISAKLYEKLAENPNESVRDEFIEEVNSLLDQRGLIVKSVYESGFTFDKTIKIHQTLFELDKGIRERLERILKSIKMDMRELHTSKKSDQQYLNPYGHVQVMDGMYYDKKK
ncbi:flagellar protein FliT [Lysinibacillus sp. 2017]|uniref:flagellar protein FliT n=1 Tax=unclassified Lysinibacillus TaxID=2636778 RepID=UPI000D5259D0|nr:MULTISPECIES: flagellar protein FliT [unclassified Lysinibacillus]AWE06406.1 flagellar protein FliT [Lysinibacillus sp. 2017]TGN33412.1 flagellar protein FliT [Lysinibacillus sp. S2017]